MFCDSKNVKQISLISLLSTHLVIQNTHFGRNPICIYTSLNLLFYRFQWPSTVSVSKSSGQNKLGFVAAVRPTTRCSSSFELVSTCRNMQFISMSCPFKSLFGSMLLFFNFCGRHIVTQRLVQAGLYLSPQIPSIISISNTVHLFHSGGNIIIHFTAFITFLSQYSPDPGWENTYTLTRPLPQQITRNSLNLA